MRVERSVYITITVIAALMTVLPWVAGQLSEDIFFEWPFFFEVAITGLLSGVMYSLVALGFVLIFKASGVLNFAQGGMVLFSALSFVGLSDLGVPLWLCFILTAIIMLVVAMAIERVVLRKLVNQEPIVFFMATIGIAYILDGLGQIIWGAEVRTLDLGLPSDPSFFFDGKILINQFDMFAALIAAALVAILVLFFQYTKTGRALRAVADDHQAALSVGISLQHIWVVVWTVAGLVGLVAGIMWGSKLGVQFSLALIALKALPVLILGGFTSIPGAIIGGLIIGAGEKISEVFLGPLIGGGIEDWFAYMLALVFLSFRPQGLFGDKIIERV